MFVLNVVDGCMPSDLGTGTFAQIEEDQRLLYVAMTHAKDDLQLVTPQRFFTHGQHAQTHRARSRSDLERLSIALLRNEVPLAKPVRFLGVSLSSL